MPSYKIQFLHRGLLLEPNVNRKVWWGSMQKVTSMQDYLGAKKRSNKVDRVVVINTKQVRKDLQKGYMSLLAGFYNGQN